VTCAICGGPVEPGTGFQFLGEPLIPTCLACQGAVLAGRVEMKKTAQAFKGTVPKEAFPDSNTGATPAVGEPVDPFPEPDTDGDSDAVLEELGYREGVLEEEMERIEARQAFSLEMLVALDRERKARLLESKLEEIESAVASQEAAKRAAPEPDMVNHPSHYTAGKYEAVEVLDDWFPKDPHIWNAVKYLSRYAHKGKPVQDLEKAIWYIRRRIRVLQGAEEV
jgi:hypothetical protein